jgi:Acetyltransferase (GNAT) domain
MKMTKVEVKKAEEGFTLAPYRSGDELDILSLWRHVFGADRTSEHWQWQFRDNPHGKFFIILARDIVHQSLIGQCAVMPVDLNLMGKRLRAGQAVDTMVHPDFRMKGIFEKSAKNCFELLKNNGFALVYGFPNRNAFPGWIRKLGWSRITFATQYYLRLSILDALKRALPVFGVPSCGDFFFRQFITTKILWKNYLLCRNLKGVQFEISDKVPLLYEELWDSVRSYEILSIWKDCRYFQWRYDRKPGGSYVYYYLKRHERIEALCVASTTTDGLLRIAELLVRDHSILIGRHLIAEVVLRALREGARRISFSGASQDFFDEVFRGFERLRDMNHAFCLGVLGDSGLSKIAESPFNWTITDGDSDSI